MFADLVFGDFREAAQHRIHGGGVNVHAAHADHIVEPAENAAVEAESTVRSVGFAHEIAGSIADEWASSTAERGHDEFALDPRRHRLTRDRVDHFGQADAFQEG